MATAAAKQDGTTEVDSIPDPGKILAISFLMGNRKALLVQNPLNFAVKVIENKKQESVTFYNFDDGDESGLIWARATAVMHLRRISGGDV